MFNNLEQSIAKMESLENGLQAMRFLSTYFRVCRVMFSFWVERWHHPCFWPVPTRHFISFIASSRHFVGILRSVFNIHSGVLSGGLPSSPLEAFGLGRFRLLLLRYPLRQVYHICRVDAILLAEVPILVAGIAGVSTYQLLHQLRAEADASSFQVQYFKRPTV